MIDLFQEIKNRVSMRDVLDMYGIYPVRGNNIYRCIVHSPDKKPSANICRRDDKFYCFSCQVKMDIFDVVQHQERCDTKTAMKILDDKFNLGLLRQLSHKQKLALAKQRKERERQKSEKEWWQKFENTTLQEIREWLRFWENVETMSHLTRGEYKRGEWKHQDIFWESLKEQDRLNWLYCRIAGTIHEECVYDYLYATNKNEILKMIKKGEIEIWQKH